MAPGDLLFWVGYLTNGKHLAWYASLSTTVIAALLGAVVALGLGLAAALARNWGARPLRWLAAGYITLVRGVPDVLFFLFVPLAFEQAVEWLWATDLRLSTPEYLVLAGVSLGIVYGAFAANVIVGALRAVPADSLDAARALGLGPWQVLWLVHLPQMWIYALPGLANVWLLLLKATSLLSLLQIIDIVAWAQRLGAANYSSFAGLVHGDWRWGYFLALLAVYLVATWLSERAFAALTRHARHGLPVIGDGAP